MNLKSLLLGALIALAACSQQPAAPPSEPTAEEAAALDAPAAIIRPLYDRYLNPTDPAVTTYPALEDQAPWSADLRQKLLDMMARSNAANAPILDFDPFVNAQDGVTSNLNVETESLVPNSHAVVRANFAQDARPDAVVYDLIWENGGWRIDNMRNEQWDLRQIVMSNLG